jgi:hypothetical protein
MQQDLEGLRKRSFETLQFGAEHFLSNFAFSDPISEEK